MDTERTILSCPGRVQNWLGTAADQIKTLLEVPQPSLSGSDQVVGALRLGRERPSWATGSYSSQPTDLAPGVLPITSQIPPLCLIQSVLVWREICCENCVAEKGSRCSRDLPSCARCRKNGLFCFYTEDIPNSRRKPEEGTRARGHTREGEPDLPGESFLVVPVLKSPALLGTDDTLAAQCRTPDARPPQTVLEYVQLPLKYPTISLVGRPTDIPSVGDLMNSQYRWAVTKRQVTMLPATPTFSVLPRRTSELEVARVELRSRWQNVAANGPNPNSMRGA